MHHTFTDQLSAFADDELNGADRRTLEQHLSGCAECRKTLERIRAVKAWAPGYQGMPPARDLWQDIESRLGTRPIGSGAMSRPWHGWKVTIRLPLLAAAAVILVVLGAWGSRFFRPAQPAADVVQLVPVKHWDDARARMTNDQYEAAITELEAVLASNDTALEPATLRVIRQSLATIDQAIAEARAAIAADSTNDYLNASIAQNMRRKLGILRMATQAAAAKS